LLQRNNKTLAVTGFRAALGPAMLDLAAKRTDGAHTYFVPVDHTTRARARVGPDAHLAVEQAAIVEVPEAAAWTLARRHTTHYLALSHHQANLRRLGFDDDDLRVPGSDRLVRAIVAFGYEEAAERANAHLAAGADHVCVQLLRQEPDDLAEAQFATLAGHLGA
jgi:probable F420-dependent oxidoreductase